MGNTPPDNIRRLRRPGGKSPSAGHRLRANWPAELRCGSRRLDCVVIDISSNGAHLRVDDSVGDARDVRLVIANMPPIAATVAWQKGGDVGLQFAADQQWMLETRRRSFDPTAWLKKS